MQQFQITTGATSFDCLFSTREDPFILALTVRGINPEFFKFEVLEAEGYRIKPFFDRELYYRLVKVLSTGARTGEKLIPSVFLEQLNNAIPVRARPSNIPKPRDVIRLRSDIAEERDKPYFDTWIYWKSEDRHGPSKENRQKTLLILGREALAYSIEMQASSRWSPIDLEKDWERARN